MNFDFIHEPWFPYAVIFGLSIIGWLIWNGIEADRKAARLAEEKRQELERQKAELLNSGYVIVNKKLTGTTSDSAPTTSFDTDGDFSFGSVSYTRQYTDTVEVYYKANAQSYVFWNDVKTQVPDPYKFNEFVENEEGELKAVV